MAVKKIPLCTPVCLPKNRLIAAAQTAISINPVNAPADRGIAALISACFAITRVTDETPSVYLQQMETIKSEIMSPQHLAVLTSKYWGSGGVKLTVGFMESIQDDLANRLLSHMNAWNTVAGANVQFVRTRTDPQVRISRSRGGYWSYLGTDISHIPRNKQTMNLEGFTMRTDESEFIRVVRHETGHTLGMPHEHMRQDIVSQLDPAKTTAYFMQTQGWSAAEVQQQVLTPLEESELLSPTQADETSIMTYHIPGSITLDGQPIPGGDDFSTWDKEYVKKIYPMPNQPPPPVVEPPSGKKRLIIDFTGDYTVVLQEK